MIRQAAPLTTPQTRCTIHRTSCDRSCDTVASDVACDAASDTQQCVVCTHIVHGIACSHARISEADTDTDQLHKASPSDTHDSG